jgi:hypothetical protein
MTNHGLADGQALALFLDINPGTIRKWASLGYIQRRGTGPRGRAMYDPREVTRFAATQRAKNVRPACKNGDVRDSRAA